MLGRYDEVLKAVGEIRGLIETLAEKGAGKENVKPWNVKEAILDTGREAASRSGEYKLALERNAEKVKLAKARGSTYLELARDSFSDYGPLLRLERYEEAEKLLSGAAKKFSRGRKISK